MAIVPGEGSFVALGAIVTDAELEPAEELVPPGCGSCTLCLDACPTDALIEPGVLDATRCLSTTTQARGPVPDDHAAALEDRVYGCDICQDVCPWNAGPAGRRAELPEDPGAWVSLADWLELPGDELLAAPRAPLRAGARPPLPAPQRARRARQRARPSSAELARLLRGRSRSAAARRGAPRAHGLRSSPMPSRSARSSTAIAEHDVVRAHAEVRDDDLAARAAAARRRRASVPTGPSSARQPAKWAPR